MVPYAVLYIDGEYRLDNYYCTNPKKLERKSRSKDIQFIHHINLTLNTPNIKYDIPVFIVKHPEPVPLGG